MNQLAYIILPMMLVLLFFHLRKDVNEYESFKKLTLSSERQRKYRDWVLKSFLFFGVTSLIALALVGHLSSLNNLFLPFASLLPQDFFTDINLRGRETLLGFLTGLLFNALLIGIIVGIALRRKPKKSQEASFIIGDIEALLPRNNKERLWVALLSANAGFSEELFFRLLLPILIFIVTGSAIFALLTSIVLFGFVHYYQGWLGIVATTVLGGVFTFIYLVTGNIFIAMAVHALVDLNGLLLQPWLRKKLAKSANV